MRHSFSLILCCIALSGPLFLRAQEVTLEGKDVTGLWKGEMYNDTTKEHLRYEVAISEYKGKLSGYSHTFFIIDNKEYYGVKRVKVREMNNKVVVEDVELVANNYPIEPPKGVHMLDILTLSLQDTTMSLAGPFTTNRTREYRPLTGNIHLQRKRDFWRSALVPHLEELGLAQDLSFVHPKETGEAEENDKEAVAKNTREKKERTVKEKPIKEIANERNLAKDQQEEKEPAKDKEVAVRTKKKGNTKPDKAAEIITEKTPPPEPVILAPAADVANRQIETIQSVYFKSDSLNLTLYDNGEVDGDTVSVLMNGKVIMPKVGLSTNAVRQTIYITKDTPDSIQLIMYAENLGSIPPNTGLLVVHDGEDVYEIRFSGDLQKNAAIVFRRKTPISK